VVEPLLNPPILLSTTHALSHFDCGQLPLNDYLKKFALQAQTGGGARTYVMARGAKVIGFYSLAPASISVEDAPARVIKGQGRYDVPVILMARFAVDLAEQGKGLGKALLRDALRRALNGAEAIGGRAFLVHAKDDEARNFYLKFGMEQSPTNPLHLFLLFKDIRKSMHSESDV
jgi:GNAT superfamily N-acetyltransferase